MIFSNTILDIWNLLKKILTKKITLKLKQQLQTLKRLQMSSQSFKNPQNPHLNSFELLSTTPSQIRFLTTTSFEKCPNPMPVHHAIYAEICLHSIYAEICHRWPNWLRAQLLTSSSIIYRSSSRISIEYML